MAGTGRRGRSVRPDAPAPREPRHAAPRGGSGAAQPGRSITGRPGPDRLAGGARRLGRRAAAVPADHGGGRLMAALMDLIAGNQRQILLGLSIEDWEGFDDPGRFDAHLSLGGGLDPTWLDLFSEAIRSVTNADRPEDFLDARREL